jgi:hypothetical protein
MAMDVEDKARSFVARSDRAGLAGEALHSRKVEVSQAVSAWAEREAAWGASDPAAGQEAGQVRALLGGLLLPALERLGALPPEEQSRLVNLMVPFDSDGGLNDFLLHFFQLAQGEGAEMRFDLREPFERELFILHDLYKLKRTLEVVETIRRAGRNPDARFASRFTPEQQMGILNRLEEVLTLMFTQTLPQRHRQTLIDTISPALLSAEALLERRERGLMYTFPHVLERYDYRRFFFLIYFKEGLKAKFENEERSYRYNFLHFQWLKREFLIHWLSARLRGNPDKFKLYSGIQLRGKSLLGWITERPEREGELLLEMPAAAFSALVGQLNSQVAAEERVGFEPETERFGLYHQLKAKLHEAAALARGPIQTLRDFVQEHRADAPPKLGPAPEPAPEPPPPAAPAAPEPQSPEPQSPESSQTSWSARLLDKSKITNPFLLPSASGYNTQLAALKMRLGPAYGSFAQFVAALLENTPEMNTVRRRTPKHEWTLPYLIKRVTPEQMREYLLVLGAEVKAKPRGMGYQTKEAYTFTPYFVFAAAQPEDGFGQSTGERKAAGQAFAEYSFTMPAVLARAQELFKLIKQKSKM